MRSLYGQGYYKSLLLSNEKSQVIISEFRYLLTFDTSTYLDRKEKTDLWTYFLFFYQIKIAPWRKNGNLKKIKITYKVSLDKETPDKNKEK